jgi:uncharacterized membrane protein YidH (DUF202 family)
MKATTMDRRSYMKSVLLSFLMFIVVFTAIKFDILRIFDHHIVVWLAGISFIIVMGCALYFIGAPKWADIKNAFKKMPREKNNEQK